VFISAGETRSRQCNGRVHGVHAAAAAASRAIINEVGEAM